jgi:hypothetical protein
MTTSGTTDFNLSIDDLIEEAFERCGMRPTAGYQLSSARRSLNLLFLDWANRGLNLWTIEQASYVLSPGGYEVTLSPDTVNVLSAVIRLPGVSPQQDITLDRISREEYLDLPDKTVQAQPAQLYVQRANTFKVFLYPSPNLAYTLVYYRIRRIQDAGIYTNTADVNFRFLPCLASGLAYQVALKYAPERVGMLKQIYEEDFKRAADEDRDTASALFIPDFGQ